MTIDALRTMCLALPGATEDVKWGQDLAFSIGGRMFAVVNLEPPHQLSFKCTPESFSELVERDGLIPAPYLARAMWVQEQALGEAFERPELEALLATAYELVKARLSKRAQQRAVAGAQPPRKIARRRRPR